VSRKLLTREEFEALRVQSADAMSRDAGLQKKAAELLVEADRYYWYHQANWFGEPILQLPHDMFALQDIVFRTRPRFIVETGVAWGGSILFYATLMAALGGERVIGVEIDVQEHVRQKIRSFRQLSDRITLIQGSSLDEAVVREVNAIVGGSREVLVILDSFHTHDHVLRELRLYSPLVGAGQYLVCCDTHVEHIPEIVANRPRPWGKGNNPQTAVDAFLKENDRFEVDRAVDKKLLLTLLPGGYLRCRKS
jgi:cephalosporin hydroxylase